VFILRGGTVKKCESLVLDKSMGKAIFFSSVIQFTTVNKKKKEEKNLPRIGPFPYYMR
jgi:hypothetical protein